MVGSNPLGCQCPGVPYLAGLALVPDLHWEMWANGDMDGPEPLATQEDGLCDGCRADGGGCAKRAVDLSRVVEDEREGRPARGAQA